MSMAMSGDRRADNNAAGLRADARRERLGLLGLSFPALFIVGLLVFIPVGWLFWLSLIDGGEISLAHYRRIADATHFRIFYVTFEISVLVTVLALLLGYPLAYLMSQLPQRWAGVCMIFVLIPFWTSLLVRTYAWLVLLQRRGLVNQTLQDWGIIDAPLRLVHNYTGTVIGMLHIMLPFMILTLQGVLENIDPNLISAAQNLGAKPSTSFRRIVLPLSMPGVAAGCVLVFMLGMNAYATPVLLGGSSFKMMSPILYSQISVASNWPFGSALAFILILVTLIATLASTYLLSRQAQVLR